MCSKSVEFDCGPLGMSCSGESGELAGLADITVTSRKEETCGKCPSIFHGTSDCARDCRFACSSPAVQPENLYIASVIAPHNILAKELYPCIVQTSFRVFPGTVSKGSSDGIGEFGPISALVKVLQSHHGR